MVEYATTKSITHIFEEKNSNSSLIAQLGKNTNIAVVEHDCEWSRIIKDSYDGFCKTENLNFENVSEPASEKESDLFISIPRECACALYNALKFSLKL